MIWRNAIARMRRDAGGAAAVEFALVMVPLFVVILFVLENALVHWITASLDNGLDASMRQFYVRAAGPGTEQIDGVRTELCRQVAPFVKCEALKVDVAAYASFGSVDRASPIDPATGDWRPGFGGQHGCLAKGSVVVVQAALAQHTFQAFGIAPGQFRDGSRLINAAAVIQLEGNSPVAAGC
ncbi:TadE/TadG family type IV pilus assembly protein [Methylobacterium sp. J-090]|uniref:TadE/TadG family type IV pilus assembly protein n=1 Tax=Methylobacterium sp. J-090 TaxID=2836666 RepID=UPI001FB9D6EB|nr:TadE/TadG family type IV pilus assembly protein [Methylobacterium sp. J-090]MCJ2082388.1 pilus assembly protein [Methylobacterium sp. J-090]